jgi:hypothetical protein
MDNSVVTPAPGQWQIQYRAAAIGSTFDHIYLALVAPDGTLMGVLGAYNQINQSGPNTLTYRISTATQGSLLNTGVPGGQDEGVGVALISQPNTSQGAANMALFKSEWVEHAGSAP